MGRRRWLLVGVVLATLLAGGCARPTGPWREHADGPRVVADLTANLGADRVDLVGVLKPGVDAHDYEPSPADVEAIAGAQLLVTNGVGLEDTIQASGFDGVVVDTSQGVRLRTVGGQPTPTSGRTPATP